MLMKNLGLYQLIIKLFVKLKNPSDFSEGFFYGFR